MRNLYHFTCSHRAEMIGVQGILKPNRNPLIGAAFVWLTDLAVPDRVGLGLTSTTLSCDRTEYRYRVTSHVGVEPWIMSPWRAEMPAETREDFESYGQPLRWFVTTLPLPAVRA